MRKTNCPHCRTVLTLNIPPDAPVAAQVPYLCASCGQSFLYTVGHGLPLLLARVRLWLNILPELLELAVAGGFLFAGWHLWHSGGSPAVLLVAGVMVACGLFQQRAVNDVNYCLVLVIGTASLTGLAASYFGHIHALDAQLPLMGLAVLLVLALAYCGAPAEPWSPPPLALNKQHGETRVLSTEEDLEGTGL